MNYSVLFVDDELALLDGLRKALWRAPFRVYTAPSARLALELLSEVDVDVVVSDERMPGMDGAEFLTRVHHAHPTVERIMLTGHATVEAAVQLINDAGGVARFLTKPIDAQTLQRTILEVLARAHPEDLELNPDARQRMLTRLEERHAGITHVDRAEDGAIILPVETTELTEE
jgi:two-component system probable response regulator PhcQ